MAPILPLESHTEPATEATSAETNENNKIGTASLNKLKPDAAEFVPGGSGKSSFQFNTGAQVFTPNTGGVPTSSLPFSGQKVGMNGPQSQFHQGTFQVKVNYTQNE